MVAKYLAAEAVQGAALALERVHDVQRGHRLAARVLRVGHRVTNLTAQLHSDTRNLLRNTFAARVSPAFPKITVFSSENAVLSCMAL